MNNLRILSLLFVLMLATACRTDRRLTSEPSTARRAYKRALEALDADSIHAGEQLLHQAIRLAERDDDLHTLYLSQLELARSLSWGNTSGALDMAKRALATYRRRPDSERNHIILLDYIGTYASQLAYQGDGDYREALDFAHRAYERARTAPDSVGHGLVSQTLASLANIHWAMGDCREALRCAREATDCASPELLLGAQQVLARCLVCNDSLREAEAIYRAMDYGNDVREGYIVESNLAKLALRRQDIGAAETAIDEAFTRAETLYFDALGQKEAYYQTSLRQERENERLRYRQRLQYVLILGGVVLFLILLYIALRETALRRRERRFHEQERTAHQEKLRQRDAAVDFLKDFILQRSEVVRKLSEPTDRHIVLTPHEWAEVERTLDVIDGGRFRHLRERYPDLHEEDVQLCLLTRMRLTNRAIGNLYGISISAVQHRKLKLKKEVFGQVDPETTLEQVIDGISAATD